MHDAQKITRASRARQWGAVFFVALLFSVVNLSQSLARPSPTPPSFPDLAYGQSPRQTLDLYLPAKPAAGKPVVVFFYSGDWQYGNKRDYEFVAARLMKEGYAVIIPDYRLYPDVKFPAFIEDGAAVTAWAKNHLADYGLVTSNLFLMGDSSGAYLAVMLALDSHYLGQANVKRSDLAGVIGLAGPYDFLNNSRLDTRPVLRDASNPAATQPINFADGTGPPLLLLVGSNDEIVDPANSTALAAKQDHNGGRAKSIVYPKVGHIGIMLPFSPLYYGSTDIVQDVIGFIEANKKAE